MATVTRREPFGLDLSDWVRRVFAEDRLWPEREWSRLLSAEPVLRVEEFADDGTLTVRAELPGCDPEKDVAISVHDGMLHLTAERRQQEETRGKAGYRSEFGYGRYERVLPLPAGVTEKDIEATYRDGILEVRIPLPKAAEAVKIPIQHG